MKNIVSEIIKNEIEIESIEQDKISIDVDLIEKEKLLKQEIKQGSSNNFQNLRRDVEQIREYLKNSGMQASYSK